MERLYNWLFLKAIRGLGEVSIKKLWLAFGSGKDILSADFEEAKAVVGEERAKALVERRLSFEPEEIIRLVEREGIGWLALEDEDYPALLKEIEDPPPVLFFRGKLQRASLIALVGTRKPDIQSVRYAKRVVSYLVEKGYGVVSGGAQGIDMTAHLESLRCGGYNLCVLGMGILKMPPSLQRLDQGNTLFLSEFLPHLDAEEYTFPRRNRLISALSKAVVVVEAGPTSGALITASYAIKQGKPLWVYIGATDQRWLGCIRLVNEGKAKILYSPELLLEDLPRLKPANDPLLEVLSSPKTFDELIEITKMEPSELKLRLVELEMEGKIVRNGAHYTAI